MSTAVANPTPFMISLSNEQFDHLVVEKKAEIDDKRQQVEHLSAELTRLNREFIALEQEQLRRRCERALARG